MHTLSKEYCMEFRCSFFIITVLLGSLLPSFAQGPTILRHGGSVQTVKFSPVNDSLIASASDNSTIKLWNLQNDTSNTLRGHNRKIHSVAFSPDGKLLVSGSDDWTFRFWDVQSQQHISTHEHINNRTRSPITEIEFSYDGQLLATAGQHVKLWEVNSRTEMTTLQHDAYVWGIAFSPTGQFLAAGDQSGGVKIWDIQEQQVVAELEGDSNYVYSVAFSPNGRILASAGYDGKIKLWTTADWTLIGTLQNRGTAYSIEFSPDGKVLASSGYQVVTLWSIESGELIASLSGYPEWVFGVAFSPDGNTLASAADDGTVRVQNIESHLQTLQQREMVRLIYFLPNNRSAQQDIDTNLDTLIRDVQEFYAEQMHHHGFDRKTFTFETNAAGNAEVHHVNGRFTDGYYNNETLDKVIEEIEDRFDLSTNLYCIFIDIGSEKVDLQWCGRGGIHGTTGGRAIIPASGSCFDGETGINVTAHELGHAFGLEHDFRNDAYLMSYGGTDRAQLSHCAAEWLDVHAYFNSHRNSFNESTTMTMHTPIALTSNATLLRFEVRDTDGLHQAQLIIPTHTSDPADGVKLLSCKTLNGENQQVEFTVGTTTEVTLRIIDVNGNFTQETFPIIPDDIARVDVNMDGIIDVADLVLVATDFGTAAVQGAIPQTDVNNDGFVNRADLLLVVEVLESDESIPMEPTSTTIISLAPTIVSSPAIGEQLTFSLNIADGQNIAGYQATVSYDTTALRYVDSVNGNYLPSGAFFVPPITEGNTVTLASSSLAGERNGDGTLATLTFEVVAVKVSTVQLTNVLLTNSYGGSSIPQTENAEITEPPQLPEDVNKDGIVNIVDLTLVATNFGKTGTNDADVNGDGVVNIVDLTLVASAFGNTPAAPYSLSFNLENTPTRAEIIQWINQARQMNLTDPIFQHGILVLEQLLAALTPTKTALLPNYPNPFNPETWIPYQLEIPADVSISIYATDGKLIRKLDLGHQPVGVYQHRSNAAHWDGKNEFGEPVASGVYFYTLTAGDFTATRRMLIRK